MGNKRVTSVLASTSVNPPLAQTPKLCVPGGQRLADAMITEVFAKARQVCSHRDLVLLDLLLCSGVRVGEVCSISPLNIVDDRRVWIRGEKGSGDRLCTLVRVSGLLQYQGTGWGRFNYGLNRYYVYRLCKRVGVYAQIFGNKRAAVTHAGRHMFVEALSQAGADAKQIQSAIGHKSERSTQHYLKHHTTR